VQWVKFTFGRQAGGSYTYEGHLGSILETQKCGVIFSSSYP